MYLAAGAAVSRTGGLDQHPRAHWRRQQRDRCRSQEVYVPPSPCSLENLGKLANQ
jgi:hypothetical protein